MLRYIVVSTLVSIFPLAATAAEPQRWALLVGVDDYVALTDLRFCGNDAAALADSLLQAGFDRRHVRLLHDGAKENSFRPFKANIEQQLDNLLSLAEADDLVIVSFSGHGMHIDGKSYLCPNEANDTKPDQTMIAVDDVYKKFSDCKAALKLLIVDACRNDPRPAGRKSATPSADRTQLGAVFERPPEGIVVLASCAPGQISWEDEGLKHGVFMHHVLDGLSGKADGNKNGRVTLGELYDYASSETKLHVFNKFNDAQVPAQRGEINGVFELPRSSRTVEIVNSIGLRLTQLPAGEFLMGTANEDPVGYWNETPRHTVRITKAFYIGTFEVTRGQFAQFVAATNYVTEPEQDGLGGRITNERGLWEKRPETNWRDPGFAQTDEHPVVNVTWNDAKAFCDWLSEKEGNTYRLPTEAEWEYACRAGTETRYYNGDEAEGLVEIANIADATAKAKFPSWETIAGRDGYLYTAPVGRFAPNKFGLYDMSGNVWEWCDDWYDMNYYKTSRAEDPAGFTTGEERVSRGGSWDYTAVDARSAHRSRDVPSERYNDVGFRVVREE
jgi:formylglycine-generating enzyme required for sulfatase activity